jgi:hypothetical protein
MSNPPISWLKKPQGHDYPAAASYLHLIYDEQAVAKIIKRLKKAAMTTFKSKDIFRASRLSLLGVSNSHVVVVTKKINEKIALSPLLLVRDPKHATVIIADGYHRLCAVYRIDEDAIIPCKIA